MAMVVREIVIEIATVTAETEIGIETAIGTEIEGGETALRVSIADLSIQEVRSSRRLKMLHH